MDNTKIRVRYAPSPTGYIHIGNLRTALYNYLFSRHNNGTLILRVEDTDKERKVEGAVENLISSLKLLGIEYDEGPFKDGEYGPYFQSERLDIYMKYALELVEKGDAYYAFETSAELDAMREKQLAEGKQTMYDGKARDFSKEKVEELLASGIPYVIRLKVPRDSEVTFEDIVKGTVTIETNLIDDQILIKSDGYPTYHLANVIDDHLMEVSHIIRGEEWVTSVPKHVLIYESLGWKPPVFAHAPLILNPDKSKLSKRQGDVAVEDYLRKGYLKETLINFLAFLGWNPGEGEEEELLSMDELISKFTLERVHKAGAIFNIDKLNWMNNHYIKEYDLDSIINMSLPYFEKANMDISNAERMLKIISLMRVYVDKLEDLPVKSEMFFTDKVKFAIPEEEEILKAEDSKRIMASLKREVESEEKITPENFKEIMKKVQDETKLKGKGLYKPVRLALLGSEHGPDLAKVAEILGKEQIISFLSVYL
jgi:glutamyl-tRNA synthetase